MMYQDEIVEEIHRIREEYSRSFNHNLKAIFGDLQKQQAESGREVVSLSRRHGITNPLHTDRIKLVGKSERLLTAGERGRYSVPRT